MLWPCFRKLAVNSLSDLYFFFKIYLNSSWPDWENQGPLTMQISKKNHNTTNPKEQLFSFIRKPTPNKTQTPSSHRKSSRIPPWWCSPTSSQHSRWPQGCQTLPGRSRQISLGSSSLGSRPWPRAGCGPSHCAPWCQTPCSATQHSGHYITHADTSFCNSTSGITFTHSDTLFCNSTVGTTLHTVTPCSATQRSGHYVYRQWHFVLQHSVVGVTFTDSDTLFCNTA